MGKPTVMTLPSASSALPFRVSLACLGSLSFLFAGAEGSNPGSPVRTLADLAYAEAGGEALLLDLHLPSGVERAPLVVFIHGGGWRAGSRKDTFPLHLVAKGYAVASVGYRLSQVATFPAQIHDCKGAVRWLRARAGKYGFDPDRIAVMGTSAGGHLAALLGVTGGVAELEGEVGGNPGQSSKVRAIVDFYGPTDFLLRARDQPEQTDKEGGKVFQLLGGPVGANPDLARLAGAAFHVTKDDPPLLVVHGTEDRTVLPNQSQRLVEAYRSAGLEVEFRPVEGGGHGGAEYSAPEIREAVLAFLDRHLGD